MTTDTRVTVLEPSSATVYNLDKFPESQFNRLIPTQTIAMPSDLMRPVVQIVQLDIEDDCYKSNDVPNGHKAINRRGLRKLATAGAVTIVDERRTDDGTNPDSIEVTCFAEMTLPTGARLRAPGMKRVDLNAQSWASPAQRAKYKSFFQEQVASRAENRAIRALLSLKSSYSMAELSRPFAVVSFAPNMDHPEVKARILEVMAPTVAQLYGPTAAPQLTGGQPIDVSPVEDDVDVASSTAASGDPGPVEPDWFPAAEAAPTKSDDPGPFPDRIREAAATSKLKGAMTEPQKEALRTLFAAIGGVDTGAGLQALWPGINPNALTSAQANAITAIAAKYDADQFVALWRELAT
jgi:hypothetical protein